MDKKKNDSVYNLVYMYEKSWMDEAVDRNKYL